MHAHFRTYRFSASAWLHARVQAAQAAGMRCVITYTGSTKDQDFSGAYRILEGLGGEHATLEALSAGGAVLDDRALALAS